MERTPSFTRRDFVVGGLVCAAGAGTSSFAAVKNSAHHNDAEILELTATEALHLMRSGDLTSERYTAALLKQCRKRHDLNAFIWLNDEHVLEAARAADRTGKGVGNLPLRGLPIVLKDNIDTAKAPTTAGTPALRDNRPRADAPVAASLFSAGALLLGKTNMHELAFGITSNNAAFGAVHNPYNLAMIPGGSSGGTAAAIAGRLCPVGLGTDTGGSVRIPAALCGIVGLRTSSGRYSTKGVVPLSHTRDVVGPLARVVRDLILVDSIITGESAAVEPVRLKGLRLGVPRSFFYEDLDSELSPVVESALAKLRDAGCILVEADIPDIEKLSAISGRLSYFECMADLARYLKDSGIPLTAREVVEKIASPDVKKVYEESVFGPKAPTAESYQHALTVERPALQAAYREYFRTQDVAAIVFPTTILPARPIGDDTDVELNGKRLPTLLTFTHNARPVTSAGLPGLSIPIGQTASGLPVGLEFDGPEGADRSLLGMGLSAEKVFGRLRAPAV